MSGQGRGSISSKDLADLIGVNPWKIRKDFSYFGYFGIRGVGYEVDNLSKQIKKILKLDVVHRAALIGVGNVGSALLMYPGFGMYSFDIAAAFDINPKKVGRKIGNVVVEDVSNLRPLRARKIKIGIIAVPHYAAQDTADKLVEMGVRGILNFSPRYITVPKKIKVITIDIAMDLARLPYYMPSC